MSPSRLFGGVVWLGIAANAGFALPAILAPDRFAAFFLGQIALGLLPRAYWPFGAADLSLGIVQLALLARMTTGSHFSGNRNSWRV
jgi:hypothetical protein